jgi:hypothetical protein
MKLNQIACLNLHLGIVSLLQYHLLPQRLNLGTIARESNLSLTINWLYLKQLV